MSQSQDWLVETVRSWQTAVIGGLTLMIAAVIRRHVTRVDMLADKIDAHAKDEFEARDKDRATNKADFQRVNDRLDRISERLGELKK